MPKILVIDDRRENIVFIVNNILKPLGYDVITARDGQMGLEKAQEEMPDLIISDLKLPKLNGLDVLAQLRKRGIFTPAIVMTFHGSEETAVRALRLGVKDYLIKPFTLEDMQAALDRAFKPQPTSVEAYRQKLEAETRIKSLEDELAQARTLLERQRNQLELLQRQAVHPNDNNNHAVSPPISEQAVAAWEADKARFNRVLAQTKFALSKSEGRSKVLKDAVLAQRAQTGKYQKEAKRLAGELRNLSEAIRLMSQDMEQQMNKLAVFIPQEEV
jgi:DNA-binding response OmpR family regulator